MAEKAKSTGKPITDVAHPNKSAPAQNSKSVIVTNRPMLKDPMVVDEGVDASKPLNLEAPAAEAAKPSEEITKKPEELSIKPEDSPKVEESKPEDDKPAKNTITEIAAIAAADKPAEDDKKSDDTKATDEPKSDKSEDDKPASAEDTPKPEPDNSEDDESKDASDNKTNDDTNPDQIEIEDAKAAKHEAEVQKLSDSKKYFLPINAVEKRRSKQFVILGVVLSIILALAWVDIALDAALIKIPGVKPVTHLFSN